MISRTRTDQCDIALIGAHRSVQERCGTLSVRICGSAGLIVQHHLDAVSCAHVNLSIEGQSVAASQDDVAMGNRLPAASRVDRGTTGVGQIALDINPCVDFYVAIDRDGVAVASLVIGMQIDGAGENVCADRDWRICCQPENLLSVDPALVYRHPTIAFEIGAAVYRGCFQLNASPIPVFLRQQKSKGCNCGTNIITGKQIYPATEHHGRVTIHNGVFKNIAGRRGQKRALGRHNRAQIQITDNLAEVNIIAADREKPVLCKINIQVRADATACVAGQATNVQPSVDDKTVGGHIDHNVFLVPTRRASHRTDGQIF